MPTYKEGAITFGSLLVGGEKKNITRFIISIDIIERVLYYSKCQIIKRVLINLHRSRQKVGIYENHLLVGLRMSLLLYRRSKDEESYGRDR